MNISIIIPTKNEQQNLPRLLLSIRNAQTPPEEIIIIDNRSTDGTVRVAKDVWGQRKSNPPLRIITKGRERSQQRNAGAQRARGTHLLFLDADMEILPSLPAKLLSNARKGATAVVIKERAVGHDFWGKAIALERNCYTGKSLLEAPRFIEAKTFKKLGGYDPSLIAGEDWDLSERLNNHGVQIIRTHAYLIHHETSGFLPNLRRKWYYTQHIRRYAHKHPNLFVQQASPIPRLRIFWDARNKLMKYPAHTLAFLILKTIIYIRFRLTRQ